MADKKCWVIQAHCTITKEFVLRDCTREEAWNNPVPHILYEKEVKFSEAKVFTVLEVPGTGTSLDLYKVQ